MIIDIVIPVKDPIDIVIFLTKNRSLLEKHNVIVIDSKGGELLQSISKVFVKKDLTLWDARREGYLYSKSEFILNLDSDVILPENYIEESLKYFANNKIGAVSSFFYNKQHRGILEFGCSIWRSDVLKNLYDFNPQNFSKEIIKIGPSWYSQVRNGYCECLYMWEKLNLEGLSVEYIPLKVEHLNKS